jgi:hypothetical protein
LRTAGGAIGQRCAAVGLWPEAEKAIGDRDNGEPRTAERAAYCLGFLGLAVWVGRDGPDGEWERETALWPVGCGSVGDVGGAAVGRPLDWFRRGLEAVEGLFCEV